MSDSIHDKLKRVRKPRVHITYDLETNGSVVARVVLKQGVYSESGIRITVNVIAQDIDAHSCIGAARCIGSERVATDGYVGISGNIVEERVYAVRRVPGTSRIIKKSECSIGGVVDAGRVA